LIGSLLATFAKYDRRFWVLVGVQLIVAAGFGAAMPFVSIYLHTELGKPMSWVGSVMLISAVISAVGRSAGGEISDRIGRRPVLLIGMAARTLAFGGMTYMVYREASAILVAGAYLAVRLMGAFLRPALAAMVADVVGPKKRVEAYAVFRIGQNVGWAIGPALGGFLVASSYASVFLLTTTASLVGLILVALFTSESLKQPNGGGQFSIREMLSAARDTRFLLFCGWSVLLFIVGGQYASTLAVFSTDVVGITKAQLGWLFTVNGISVVLFQWPAARLTERIGIRWGLAVGCILTAVGYLTVGLAPGFVFLVGSMIIITLGEVTFQPTSMAAVANMAPALRVGRYMGLFGLTEALGWSLGPFLGGMLYDRLFGSPLLLWALISSLAFIATAGFAVSRRLARALDGQQSA